MQDPDLFYDWSPACMLEITLDTPDAFLKVKETLTRIGIASKRYDKLYQSAHILHKQGRYYIVHFKELFILDGKDSTITQSDIDRRNAIGCLLDEWGLLKLINRPNTNTKAALSQIKVLSFREKGDWELIPKYTIGQRRNTHARS